MKRDKRKEKREQRTKKRLRTTTLFTVHCSLFIVLAAVLFVLSGCLNYDLPPRTLITAVNVFENDSMVDYVYFNNNVRGRTLTAMANATKNISEDDGLSYTWSVVSGDDIVEITETTGGVATVIPKTGVTDGVAKIRAEAFFEHSSDYTDLYVFVNPGNRDWSFLVFNESTEITDKLVIATGNTKTVTLREFGSGLSFTKQNADSAVVTDSTITDKSFTLKTSNILKKGSSEITVTAAKDGVQLPKKFTVNIGIEPEEGVLFMWDSDKYPIDTDIPQNGTEFSGYGDVYFRTTTTGTVTSNNGALKYSSTTSTAFIIGGSVTPATTAERHVPGVFDLSEGTFRLTIDYRDLVVPTWVRVQINNNTNGMTNSVLGTNGILLYAEAANVTAGQITSSIISKTGIIREVYEPGRVTLTFTPEVRYATAGDYDSLKTAFLAVSSSATAGNDITITGIRLEEVK